MSRARILQICYSPESRAALDPGFEALDNGANERADWREYWPIRRSLLAEPPAAGEFVGFLSPRFREKTGLTAARVFEFLAAEGGEADVVSFSPYYDQSTFFINPIEQAHAQHPNILEPFERVLELIAPRFEPRAAFVEAYKTIFCNYFVACGAFWRCWLETCERIFAIAECDGDPLGRALNADARHGGGAAAIKTFVIERIVSVMLATEPGWRVRAYDPLTLPTAWPGAGVLRTELVALDALKSAYVARGAEQFRESFFALRERVLAALDAHRAPARMGLR